MKTTVRILGVFIILLILFASAASIWRAERDKTELRESQAAIAEAQQSLALLKEEAKNMTGESKVQIESQIAEAESDIKKLPPNLPLQLYKYCSGLLCCCQLFSEYSFFVRI
ncbi:hypothetical protein H9W95_06300 [Flavobacterium lindanitolerans]|nr:hypothetical protein [Flavobacterium lindanitolerans]